MTTTRLPFSWTVGPAVAVLARMARQAVRSREETKSGLVAVTTAFKEAYRRLAKHLVNEGLLPDRDAVFFLTHEELGLLARDAQPGLAAKAIARREAFGQQETYEFPDVCLGNRPASVWIQRPPTQQTPFVALR